LFHRFRSFTALEITLDKKADNHGILNIRIEEADYKDAVTQKLKEYRKQVSLKGFRPGKVPLGLVQKMVGKDLKAEEVSNTLQSALENYLREEALELVGDPIMQEEGLSELDWAQDKEFSFAYEIGFVHDLVIPNPKDISIKRYKIQVTEAEVDEMIESVQERLTDYEASNAPATENSRLSLEIETGGEEPFAFLMDLQDLTEEQRNTLIGKQDGDSFSFVPEEFYTEREDKYYAQFRAEDAEANTAVTAKLEEVQEKQKPELDEDFFETIFGPGEVEDLEAFRAKIKETITEDFANNAEEFLGAQAFKLIREETTGTFPKAFLDVWFEKNRKEDTKDEDKEKHLEELETVFMWNLIKGRIIRENELEVSEEDIQQEAKNQIAGMFQQMGMAVPGDEQLLPFAQNWLSQENGKNYREAAANATERLVIEFLKDHATIVEEEVSKDKYNEIVEAHQAK